MLLDAHLANLTMQTSKKEGVVTLADKSYCEGLMLLSDSIRQSYDVPIVCYDGGMTKKQRQLVLARNSNIEIRAIPTNPQFKLLKETLSGDAGCGREEWLLWACPLLIASSPFRRTLWLDCDLVVLQNLRKLFQLLNTGPVFTPSDNKSGTTPNHRMLYKLLPLSKQGASSPEPLLNAGVIGFDLKRDRHILMSYIYPVLCAACDESVRTSISWHDQGALIWAVRNHCLHNRIVNASWNTEVRSLPIGNPDLLFYKYKWERRLFSTMREDFPTVNILHWNGRPNKLWHFLNKNKSYINKTRKI
jgi:hypothetical protein